jgi:hypothetical protein
MFSGRNTTRLRITYRSTETLSIMKYLTTAENALMPALSRLR